MRKTSDVLRMLLVSPEVFWLLAIISVFLWKDAWLSFIGQSLLKHEDVTTWMPAIPVALCGAAFLLVFKLLAPSEANNRLLYNWPDYWRLEYRRNLGVAWCVFSVALALIAWIFRDSLSSELVGGLFLISIGLAVISCGSMMLGACKLKVIIEMFSD